MGEGQLMAEGQLTLKEVMDNKIHNVRHHLEQGTWEGAATILSEIRKKLQDSGENSDAALTQRLSELLEDVSEFLQYTQPIGDEEHANDSRRKLLTETQKCYAYVQSVPCNKKSY